MDRVAENIVSSLLLLLDTWHPGRAIPAVGIFTANEFVAALMVLGVAAFLSAAIGYALRRRSAVAASLASATNGPRRVAANLSRPLHGAVALYAIYFAALPFLLAFRGNQAVDVVRDLLRILFDLGGLAALVWFGLRLFSAIETRLIERIGRKEGQIDKLLIPLLGSCLRVALIVFAIDTALTMVSLPDQYTGMLSKITSVVFIVAVASVFARSVRVGEQMVLTRYDVTAADNLQARKVYTQIHVIGRVVYFVIGLVSAAAILMLFDQVRHIGTSILASAGIAGIIVGFAAQKTLANLFAGFQIALAQPMREDDVVIVEGEWGRVEEINLSYVVVHIWDDRRLVVPLSYFIEKPFQNWTRTSAAILGSVMVYVDYTCDVATVRHALTKMVEKHPLWDGRFWNLQVTDARERTLELRVLATSADASKSFDLRCAIREELVAFIQKSAPQWLPRGRVSIGEPGTATGGRTCPIGDP